MTFIATDNDDQA